MATGGTLAPTNALFILPSQPIGNRHVDSKQLLQKQSDARVLGCFAARQKIVTNQEVVANIEF